MRPLQLLTLLVCLAYPWETVWAQHRGAVESSETRLLIQTEQLDQIGLRVEGTSLEGPMVNLSFDGRALGTLDVKTNEQGAPHAFLNGALHHRGKLELTRAGRRAALDQFVLRGAPDDTTAIIVTDSAGNEWFRGDFIHYHDRPGEFAATLKEMDLTVSRWLAAQLGEPKLAGFVIGTMEVDIEFASTGVSGVAKGEPCGDPVWIDEQAGLISDIRLTKLGKLNSNSVNPLQQRARQDGFVAVTVNAQLDNDGNADAPWYEKFRTYQGNSEPINPPYDNDQHPYLVWAMYRETGSRLESLGFSSAKHAFYAVNTPCVSERSACVMNPTDGRLLRYGCQDFYGIASNDNPVHLGPRSEIEASTAVWVANGSFFDKDGNGVQDPDTTSRDGPFDRRMRVLEADLDLPGARYIAEAWYINRDDADIYNSMGNVEVDPDLVVNGSTTWFFPIADGATYEFGPAINQWVDPDAPGAGEGNDEIVTSNGRLRIAAKTEDLGDGRYRYVYVLMNLDYDPQVRKVSIPMVAGAAPSDYYFADGDHDPATDWTPSVVGNTLEWTAPTGLGVDWGLMVTMEFVALAAPETDSVTLSALETAAQLGATLPGPTGQVSNDLIFDDGFEEI